MPFPMKIQPVDIDSQPARGTPPLRIEQGKPVLKSRLKRLFDRQFPNVLRASAVEKQVVVGEAPISKDGGTEFEPSLAKMVQSYMEESHNDKQQQSAKCGRSRCNCFNGNVNDSSDDEFDVFGDSFNGGSPGDACDMIKSLLLCAGVLERNLLAETVKIVEKNKSVKRKDDLRNIVTEGLSSLGYDSSICKSKWEKSPGYPAGEYEYIDVMVGEERILIDIDFRSEFEMARSTGAYKAIVQFLPFIFVGKSDRLDRIVTVVSEAARQSLKKKGMHQPPWRKTEYTRAKWLSHFTRSSENKEPTAIAAAAAAAAPVESESESEKDGGGEELSERGELDLIFGDEATPPEKNSERSESVPSTSAGKSCEDVAVSAPPAWQPPAVKLKNVERGAKVVTGLASLLKETS